MADNTETEDEIAKLEAQLAAAKEKLRVQKQDRGFAENGGSSSKDDASKTTNLALRASNDALSSQRKLNPHPNPIPPIRSQSSIYTNS